MTRYKRFAALFIVLLIFSTFAAAAHFHEDPTDHHDCSVCVASNHQFATGPSTVVFNGIPCLTETTAVASAPARIDKLVLFSRSTRGPPA